ncbi:MAG: HK97 gp10 family phage protein [Candidatus Dormibacteraeota bacterium]|nr:HK97 gp10 family phage protein [Candidatus Dormibacteraeota bacterium]
MADELDVQVHGLTELNRGARRLFDNIDQGAGAAFGSVADQVATMVRGRVPRLTGRLASSVVSDQADDAAQVAMGDGVPYAGWIEFGGTRGRPYIDQGRYLYPTAQAAAPLLARAGETVARDKIRSMAWPTPTGA